MASGGIPGAAVDGVSMAGTAAEHGMDAMFSGFLSGKGRLSFVSGSTMLLKDGKPYLAFGTPGTPNYTVPQVLANLLEFNMEPYEATCAPRFWPLQNNYTLEIESRLAPGVSAGMAKLGVAIKPMEMHAVRTGSFQVCWRDPKSGKLNASADPRRCGKADGI
jgi:gamma-glutamyltranspeptidase/glutathione hydrolase